MLTYKYSPNRVFFINEYWILIPIAILIDILIIKRGLAKKKEKNKQLQKEVRLRRILALAFGGNSSLLVSKGGMLTPDEVDFVLGIATVPEEFYDCICSYPVGASYLNNERFIKIILDKFGYKTLANQVIYITVSALCSLINENGVYWWAAPITIRDYGITNVVQVVKKTTAVGFLAAAPIILTLTAGPLQARFLRMLPVLFSGIRLVVWNPEKIATSLISPKVNIRHLETRIPTRPDVIVMNMKGCNKITMPDFKVNPSHQECWLADQALTNKQCWSSQIPDDLTSLDTPDINYDEALTLRDTTNLPNAEFQDIEDLGRVSKVAKVKAKLVKFIEKYNTDSSPVSENEGWEPSSQYAEKKYLRYRERN